jgi:DNA-directed RNA polymerase I and III subunit RPAC1
MDDAYTFKSFSKGFDIRIITHTPQHLVFDMVGIDAALANAFRRILLGEIPTMAVHTCTFSDNTSIISDEVLAHRLGLIPIAVDPRKYSFEDELVFRLRAECKSIPGADPDMPPEKRFIESSVYSSSMQCVSHPEIRPVDEKILIAKLRPGQVIDVEMTVKKGYGWDHTKWSPVDTASYRLMPQIDIIDLAGVRGRDAEILKRMCPMNVFDIEDGAAVVARPRQCTMCRECIRTDDWNKRVRLSRVKNHFIFSIESLGAMTAADIFREACKVLREKSAALKEAVTEMEASHQ